MTMCPFSHKFLYDEALNLCTRKLCDVIKPSSSTSEDHSSQGILGTMNFVIYAYDMLLLFLPSLSLSVAPLYMLHIIDSCDDACVQIIDGEEVLRQEYTTSGWSVRPRCTGFQAANSSQFIFTLVRESDTNRRHKKYYIMYDETCQLTCIAIS